MAKAARRIGLPRTVDNNPPANTTVMVVGWGQTSSYDRQAASELQGAYLPLITNKECGRRLRQRIRNSKVCADNTGASACKVSALDKEDIRIGVGGSISFRVSEFWP